MKKKKSRRPFKIQHFYTIIRHTHKKISSGNSDKWSKAYDMIKLENDLINHRITAFLATNAFLFSGLYLMFEKFKNGPSLFLNGINLFSILFTITCCTGIAISYFTGKGVRSAARQICASSEWLHMAKNKNAKTKNITSNLRNIPKHPPITGKPSSFRTHFYYFLQEIPLIKKFGKIFNRPEQPYDSAYGFPEEKINNTNSLGIGIIHFPTVILLAWVAIFSSGSLSFAISKIPTSIINYITNIFNFSSDKTTPPSIKKEPPAPHPNDTRYPPPNPTQGTQPQNDVPPNIVFSFPNKGNYFYFTLQNASFSFATTNNNTNNTNSNDMYFTTYEFYKTFMKLILEETSSTSNIFNMCITNNNKLTHRPYRKATRYNQKKFFHNIDACTNTHYVVCPNICKCPSITLPPQSKNGTCLKPNNR